MTNLSGKSVSNGGLPRGVMMSALVALSLLPTAAHAADDAAASAPQPGDIVVSGEAYATERAIRAKRDQGVVSDTIASSEIGSLPEFGLGEALQRIPGVSFVINNGRGEAQFMTLRGLNPDYNSVMLDGVVLPSTEETRRQVSFDVLPSVIADQVTVYKTWSADLPSDAIGGVTDLKTHSAFDHQGWFTSGHLDYSYWENRRNFHGNPPSGQGDLLVSKTFGSNDQFGVVLLGSYYARASSSLNSYSLPYSYYNYNAAAGGAQTVNSTPLTPATSVKGLLPIPDRRRWYSYDNMRERPGGYAKFEFDDHQRFRAHLSGGVFEHTNDENRYSQYLNRGPATATITGPDQATFATGSAETDYDHYTQYRRVWFAELGGGMAIDDGTRIDALFNYASSLYRQNTTEDVFTTATSATFAPVYVGQVSGIPLFQPANPAAFADPTNYLQTYHLNAVDRSTTRTPQFRIDLTHNADPTAEGFGYKLGYVHRQTRQNYFYNEFRLNPIAGANINLAQIGPYLGSITPGDAAGLSLAFLDPDAVADYVAAHPGSYVAAASNLQRSTLNNFALRETVDAGYAEASYRTGPLYVQAGLRYERNGEDITNHVPDPITSTTSFATVKTQSDYGKLLPEMNISYDVTRTLKLRGAVSRTLARPRYSDLAQNQALTLSGTIATETIANPNLSPRMSNNYDFSIEFYPRASTALSVALFQKDISHEIFALTTTTQNTTLPGQTGSNFTLISTTPTNAGDARVRGVEFGINQARLPMLPGRLSNFGFSANVTALDMDAPSIQMSDKTTFRKLPQLLESPKFIANATLFYREGRFSGEAAFNHTGKMPLSFDTNNAVNDQWYRATNTLDAQISFRVRKGLEVRLQGKNLTDETNQKVVGPSQTLNYSLLDNGRAYYAGVSFAY